MKVSRLVYYLEFFYNSWVKYEVKIKAYQFLHENLIKLVRNKILKEVAKKRRLLKLYIVHIKDIQ